MQQPFSDDRFVSLGALEQYRREVHGAHWLTEEEEARMVQRVLRGRQEQQQEVPNQWVLSLAKDARARLVESYQALVVAMAWRFANNRCRMDVLDLVQDGNIGLLRALDRGNYQTPRQLCVWVKACARGEMVNALRDRGALVRIPKDVFSVYKKIAAMEHSLQEQLGRFPTLAELAHHLGLSECRIVEVKEAFERLQQVESLQQAMMQGEDEEEGWEQFVGLYQQASEAECERSRKLEEALQQALKIALTERQRTVIQLRYGLDGEGSGVHKQVEIAEMFGVTDRAVGIAERKAKTRLKRVLAPVYAVAQEELRA